MTPPTPSEPTEPGLDAAGSADRIARRSLMLLLVLNLLTYMDRQVLAGVESLIARDLLPNDPNAQAKMGILATMFLVSYMVCSPVFGILGDKMSRWVLVSVGTILGSLATGWTGVAASFAGIFAARCVVGISEAAYAPVAPTLLSDLFPIERRGRVLAWFYAAIPVGSALGYAFGGLMAQHFGWRWAFLGLVVPGVIVGLIPLLFRDPRPRAHPVPPAPEQPVLRRRIGVYRDLFRIRSYFYCCAGMTAMTFALGGISFWMPRYIHETRGFSTLGAVNLTLGGIVVVAGLFATLAGGWAGDKLRGRYPGSYFLVSGGGLLIGFPLFIAVLFVPFPYAWLPLAGAVFFLFFNTGPANTILANVTAPPVRTTAFALNIFIIHALGDAISPPLIGVLSDRIGLGVSMGLVGLMFLVGGVLWLMGARHLEGDSRRVAEAYPDVRPGEVPLAG
jgi:MFS family permease